MKTRFATLTAILATAALALTACAGSFAPPSHRPPPRTHRRRTITDHAGNEVVLPPRSPASPSTRSRSNPLTAFDAHSTWWA